MLSSSLHRAPQCATGHAATRRQFLAATAVGGLAVATGASAANDAAPPRGRQPVTGRVALTAGDDRAGNVFRALQTFSKEIARAIGSRRVVIKPNNVVIDNQLAATHADCLDAILEFLKSIGKAREAIIAESAANGSTMDGFANYGYPRVAAKHGVRLVDLDQEPYQTVFVLDERDMRPHAVRMSSVLLDPNAFIISAAKPKAHDRVVVTLSLKNIVFAAPIKDVGYAWRNGKRGARSDKATVHGGGVHANNYNLFALAQRLAPDLSVIDAFDGMQGNGPNYGDPVDHRVCVVSQDWLAADRVGVELMGVELSKVGYLTYCAAAGMGEADLSKIEVIGEPIARHVTPYKLADNIEQQLTWMQPLQRS